MKKNLYQQNNMLQVRFKVLHVKKIAWTSTSTTYSKVEKYKENHS